MARCIKEIFTGERGEALIPVELYTDSESLVESVESTKQVDNRLMRPLVKFIKQLLDAKMINKLSWCDTKVCVADILTKPGAPLGLTVLEVLRRNQLIDM